MPIARSMGSQSCRKRWSGKWTGSLCGFQSPWGRANMTPLSPPALQTHRLGGCRAQTTWKSAFQWVAISIPPMTAIQSPIQGPRSPQAIIVPDLLQLREEYYISVPSQDINAPTPFSPLARSEFCLENSSWSSLPRAAERWRAGFTRHPLPKWKGKSAQEHRLRLRAIETPIDPSALGTRSRPWEFGGFSPQLGPLCHQRSFPTRSWQSFHRVQLAGNEAGGRLQTYHWQRKTGILLLAWANQASSKICPEKGVCLLCSEFCPLGQHGFRCREPGMESLLYYISYTSLDHRLACTTQRKFSYPLCENSYFTAFWGLVECAL